MPPPPSFMTLFEQYLPHVEKEMRAIVRTDDPRHADLFGMLQYHMGWADETFAPCQTRTGKRIRPMLCLLSCQACGGDWQSAVPAAAALELMHNFTLIHDDIEDRDRTRRGRTTLWALWGDAQGINAGDTLFALAQLAMFRLLERGVSAETVVRATRRLNDTCVDLTGGQFLDIGFEVRDDVSIDDYLAMVEGKTAALAACACDVGGLVAKAPESQRRQMAAFGRAMGLAFQMRDDLLGIWGDPQVTGKPAGADIARRKKSLPILHGLERSQDLRALFAQETMSAEDVRRATQLLEEVGSRDYTEQHTLAYHTQALAALEAAQGEQPAAQALYDLAQALLNRDR